MITLYLCGMLLNLVFVVWSVQQCQFWSNSADRVSKQGKYRNYWVLINAFWIYLRFVKNRFLRHRFARYWFRFVSRPWLDTNIPNKHFLCLQDVFKRSSRHVFKTSSRRLQRKNFSSSKTYCEMPSRHICKTSSRRLGRQKRVTLKTCWRRLQVKTFLRRLQDMWWRRF